jgi:D-glycero-D-manno-heptose 1,7-bisphosphate phosphatase
MGVEMPQSPAGIAVQLGPGSPLGTGEDPVLRARLAASGLDALRLTDAADARVMLRLHGESGWESLNLAALAATARARPGAVVELYLSGDRRSRAIAIAGPVRLLDGSPAWRLEWPGPSRPTAALLDRDGTIIEDRHYLSDPGGVTLLPGAAEGLRALAALGMRLVVVTNQSGVAAGRIRPAELAAVHERLRAMLLEERVPLDGIFSCPHAPDEGCDCRKPADGLARQAASELGIDLGRTLVAGDKDSDLGLGRGLGVATFLMATGEGPATLSSGGPPADYLVEDLRELARICAHPAGLGRIHSLLGDGAPPHG